MSESDVLTRIGMISMIETASQKPQTQSDLNQQLKKQLKELKAQTALIRKRRYHKSRLDKYKGELILLKKRGATTAELQRWLRKRRIKIAYSTVLRWMKKNEGSENE